jgi:hypothetical protein
MIRKDFLLQGYFGGRGGIVGNICTELHERIARIHILAQHEVLSPNLFMRSALCADYFLKRFHSVLF